MKRRYQFALGKMDDMEASLLRANIVTAVFLCQVVFVLVFYILIGAFFMFFMVVVLLFGMVPLFCPSKSTLGDPSFFNDKKAHPAAPIQNLLNNLGSSWAWKLCKNFAGKLVMDRYFEDIC